MRIKCFVAACSSLASALHAQVWTQLPGADAAHARSLHGGAYDLIRDRLVVFGGLSGLTAARLGDTLQYDGVGWTTVSTAVSPSPRYGHAMAFDLGRARILLFSGTDNTAMFNDTWEWDGSSWQQTPTAGAPSPRVYAAMTADLSGGGVLLQGGRDQGQVFRDLWRWTGGQWLLLDTTGPVLCAHAMTLDPHNSELVLFGGWNQIAFGDTWIWNGSWRHANVAGPSPRFGHRMTCDYLRQRVVLSGGSLANNSASGETWVFDGQSWFRLGDGPPRFNQVLDYDLPRGRCVETSGGGSLALAVWSFGGAAPGVIQPFGRGCGTIPIPSLAAVTAPRLGATLQLNVSSARGATLYLVGFSSTRWNSQPLPIDLAALGAPGCVVHVAPDLMDVALPIAGSSTHSYTVPNNAALVGVEFFAQALAADANANPAGISATNALAGTIGP